MDPNCFLPQLRSRYGALTAAEKRIADYVLQNPAQVLNLSAAALAGQAGTAASAVVRFCKSLGYSGYTDFKLRLAVELSHRQHTSYMADVDPEDDSATVLDKILSANIKALQDTLTRLDRGIFSQVVDRLDQAKNVYIYGVGTSAGLVGELQHRLMILGIAAHGFTDAVAIRLSTMNLGPEDVVVGISHSGRTATVVDAMGLAQDAGTATVCLTSYNPSPITHLCQLALTVYCDETQYPIEASTARIAQTAVLDALIAALSARRFETAVSRSARVHDLLEDIRYKGRGKK